MTGGEHSFDVRPTQQPVSAAERSALLANPGFGRVFTDHMVTIRYADGKGWYDARVEARAPIPMDPATAVLHYAQEIFEGLKAYRTADGGVTLFRPDANARRFRESAARMAMAQLPDELFLGSIQELITIDREWVPTDPEGSLYLRPFMYASEVFLGVQALRGVPVRADRLAGRLVLQGRRQAGHGLGLAGVHPGGAGRHRRGQVRRQLRGQPGRPGRGDRARL